MTNQQHHANALKALKYEQKKKERYFDKLIKREGRRTTDGFLAQEKNRTHTRLQEIAKAIAYFEGSGEQ